MCKCYIDICLVGVVIQNLELCEKFVGDFDYVVNFMMMMVEQICEIFVEFGFCFIDEVVGYVEVLDICKVIMYWKVRGFDLLLILYQVDFFYGFLLCYVCDQDYDFEISFDMKFIDMCIEVLINGIFVCQEVSICNVDCIVGIMLGSCVMVVI